MRVLIACEESQEVCKAFRARGHEAYSCDVQEPSGGHPEWHILGDALEAVKGGSVTTMDGKEHEVGKWDLLIAHPPCTFLTVSGNRWFNVERYGGRAVERLKARKEASEFFMAFINADIPCVCVENPVGYMSTHYRKPDRRMCKSSSDCAKCEYHGDRCDNAIELLGKIVAAVEQRSREHPRKTRQDVFLEQFPETELTKDGAVSICPIAVSAAYRNKTGGCASTIRPRCGDCMREFWMQEVE